MDWIVVAYHTPDPLYTKCAEILRESCNRYGLPHDVQTVDLPPGWAAGCRHKPEFVRQMLRKHYGRRALVYVDVDAEFRAFPTEFRRLCKEGIEFGARWRGGEMLASAFYVRNTTYMRDLVDQWAREVADIDLDKPFRLQEQQALQRLVEIRVIKGTLQAEKLPAAYCALYGLEGEAESPVILQKQASRKALGDKHVPVHPALEVGA